MAIEAKPAGFGWTAIFLFGIAGVFIYQYQSDAEVAQRQGTATGKLLSRDASNHDYYRYSFNVGGHTYIGRNRIPPKGAHVGDEVTVYYDPEDSGKSSLESFEASSDRNWAPVPFLLAPAVALALIAIWQWWVRRAQSRRSRNREEPPALPR